MTIKELLIDRSKSAEEKIAALKDKAVIVPSWGGLKGLQREYDPKLHPVMDKTIYPDIVNDDGAIEYQTRITYDLQRLATKRMTELTVGIPVKRVYRPEEGNNRQKEIAAYMEAIYERNRIDAVNIERCNMLFAGCEVFTLWYAVKGKNNQYGFDSDLKLRCRNFSPMLGDELYPLFDEYGDMVAMSIGYTRRAGGKTVQYFDAYIDDRHIKWSNASGSMEEVEDEEITLGKIPGVYWWRPAPIWEDTSRIVYEMEWAMSRDGNYLRRNSKPLLAAFVSEAVGWGSEKDEKEGRAIVQLPKGSNLQYVTWAQAIENLKYYITELRQSFFTQLQLPDWSYESMKSTPMSGESRKQLFIDAQLKVTDERGRLIEGFDREGNVVKAFMKAMLPESYHADIDALPVEHVVTPYQITEEKDTIQNLLLANGNEPIMSQRESIEAYGHSKDVDKTINQITEQKERDVYEPFQ